MQQPMSKSKKFSGQSLIEVVVALAVVSLLAIALITSTLITQKTSRNAANETQATKLGQQNIEQVRVFRDRKGFSVLGNGSCFTLNTTNAEPTLWSMDACSGATANGEVLTLSNTVFTRKIAISTFGTSKQVTVTVTWQDAGNTRTVSNVTILSNCVGTGSTPC